MLKTKTAKTAKTAKTNLIQPNENEGICINEFLIAEGRKERRISFLNEVNSLLKNMEDEKEAKKKTRSDEFINLEIPEIRKRIFELIKNFGRSFEMNYTPKLIYFSVLSYDEIREILAKELEGFSIVCHGNYYLITLYKDNEISE